MKWLPHYPKTTTIPLLYHKGYIACCSFCYKSFHFLNKNLVYTSGHEDSNDPYIKDKEDYIDIMCPHCGRVQETLIPHRMRIFYDSNKFWIG